jgi:2,3-dihydroxy-p-cumate/2,3-dihydroxybenzoate 3,4-dioxygenase
MVNLHDIRYVRVGTLDLDSAVRFATDIVGLQLVARDAKTAYFRSDKVAVRGDTRDHTLVYFEGDPADQSIGFDLHDPDDLDAVGAELERAGHQVHFGTREECDRRRVKAFIASNDPSGNRIEFVAKPFHAGVRYFPGRDAGVTHFSHIGLYTTNAQRDEKFWTRLCNA